MALSAQLRLRQIQSLALTPQLIQSIRLLQMTAGELEHFIDAELESNPLLERADTQKALADSPSSSDFGEPETYDPDHEDSSASHDTMAEIYDSVLEDIYPDDVAGRNDRDLRLAGGLHAVSEKHTYADSADIVLQVPENPSLRDHLREQIIFTFRDSRERILATDLSEQIDDAGYFIGSLQETAQRFHVDKKLVERIFHRLQGFDPPGIFARNLAECLALQLRRQGRLSPAMEILLKNLSALARRDFACLARICRVDRQQVMDMMEEIRFLEPKPGALWTSGTAAAVVPDAFVTEKPDGTFHVELNNALLPSLVVNNLYSLDICTDKAERAFFSQCQQHASWLMRALDQRANTLLKVISEIVRHQQAFLRQGIVALRPLNQATIAEAVGMHESTISRVISHKYIATPRGMLELRSFFSAGLGSGDSAATDAVRFQIRQMIDTESADNILSDDAIVDRLRAAGIDIARRTVAKYRESMNIASSVVRKRIRKYQK